MNGDFQGLRYPLLRAERKVSAAATNEELTSGPVPGGHMWVINWFALEDETTNFTSLRVYIGALGENHYLVEDKSLLAANLYWHEGPIYIPENRTLVFRFVGTTLADKLAAYAHGFDVVQPAP